MEGAAAAGAWAGEPALMLETEGMGQIAFFRMASMRAGIAGIGGNRLGLIVGNRRLAARSRLRIISAAGDGANRAASAGG